MSSNRVCVIGAGPSGMSFVCATKKAKLEGKLVPEVVCYEKQADWGGLWNFTWRTGTDENGELCHNGMYQSLWCNVAKEAFELPDYTFEDHFKKILPSYTPRAAFEDYLKGYWSRFNVRDNLHFNHAVRHVEYLPDQGVYSVEVFNHTENCLMKETFTHIVVATGHFSVPNFSEYPGFSSFPGRVFHSHDFRAPSEFVGKRLLVIGSSYSAEDITLQCMKFGTKSVILSYRTEAMGYKWPRGVEERPLLEKMVGQTAFFKDGSSAEVDAIILCTGYLHSFPFMVDNLRLKTGNSFYPNNLYRGILWTKGGNNQLFYLGMQNQCYTFSFFKIQAMWALDVIMGALEVPTHAKMLADNAEWVEREKQQIVGALEAVAFQTEHVKTVCADIKYTTNLDVSQIFADWLRLKKEDITNFRSGESTSIFTKNKAAPAQRHMMEQKDDSLESFLS